MSAPVNTDQLSALAQLSVSASGQLSSVLDTSSDNFEDDIPHVTEVPTLDSILNEEGDAAPTIDELGLRELLNDESVAIGPTFFQTNPEIHEHPKETSILHQSQLQGVANQIAKANSKGSCGLPTAMTAGVYIAVGTSRGLTLVFDTKEHMKCILVPFLPGGKKLDSSTYGAVSALDLIHDGSRILVGHAKGLITHWDLENNKLLRYIDDAHPPGFAVLNIRFTDDPSVILFCNSGGNVFFLKFKRNFTGLRTWHSECFFSGCNGEAFTFEPVKLESMPQHPLKEYCIVAVATVTQVVIISIAPKLEGLISVSVMGKPNTLPLLSWHFALVEHREPEKTESSVHPVLAIARDDVVQYVQLEAKNGKPVFKLLKKLKVGYTITAFKWINSQTVVAMDTTERIHLISVRETREIEVLDLKQVELVYGSSFYKSIETGGNVSPALVAASENACYNSIVASQNKLLLLGLHTLNKVTIKSWKERLACLVRDGHFVEGIELGLQFYEGKAKAVVGLSGSIKKRKEAIMEQVIDMLQGFVDIKLIVNKPINIPERELENYYQSVAKIAFDCCLRINKLDLLFGSLYDTFSGEGSLCKTVFLETLYTFVIDGKIRTVRTVVSKDLIDHYKENGTLKELQQCILSLEPQCLDIHHVVELCWSQRLYDAMLYVYNNGLHDYTTPLLELLLQLREAMRKGKSLPEHYQKIGYKLLVYIRCCVGGLAYPSGTIAPEKLLLAKTSIFETLLTSSNTHNPSDKASYPHIQTLLEFDTREFLNVLAFAFEEKEFDLVQSGEDLPGIPTRQEIVDILLQVMVQDQKKSFSPSQVGSLFTFLARQGAKHHSSIHVNEHIYDQVLTYITKTDEDVVNEERQQAVLELWHAGVLKKFDEERLLIMAESARFYRLCELLYEKRRQYSKVLSCYFRDAHRRHQTFSYIHQLMTDDQYTEIDREECTKAVLQNADVLLKTDVKATAQLIMMDFPLEVSEVTHRLRGNADLQFEFLKGIFDPKTTSRQDIQPPSHVVERYIELLCQYQPESVYNFLRTNDNYRLEEALDICAMARVRDAIAYLLERTGDIKGAFKIILETLSSELDNFGNKFVSSLLPSPEFQSHKERVEHILQALLQLCQRTSNKVDDKTRESMWLSVFGLVLSLPNKFKTTQNAHLQEAFKSIRADVLNSIMSYIKLPDILQKIIDDPSSGQFKDIKPIIVRMLDTYNYEETLLKTTNHILIHDVQLSLTNLCSLAHQGIISDNDSCSLCDHLAGSESADGTIDDVILFNCGHLYHSSCLGISGTTLGATCLLCDKSTKPSATHLPRTMTSSWDSIKSNGGQKVSKVDSIQLDHDQLRRLRKLDRSHSTSADTASNMELRLAPPRLVS